MSAAVSVEYVGRTTVDHKGTPTPTSHFKISSENSEWHLWLDAENKLIKISSPADSTEVVRD